MIEKRITHQLLESGELHLTERECTELTLPAHSTTLTLELEGEQFHAHWSGRSRQLTGDLLTERLQDYGQDGGLFRLRLVDQVYRLSLLPPGTATRITVLPPREAPKTKKSQSKAARRRTVDRQFHADTEYDWATGADQTIGFLKDARSLLGDQLKAAGFDPLELVELRLQGEELATLDDFEELLAVDVANVDRMPHQEAVARHALSRLRGRAVLADEVGLGKTIEAGLAVKELTLRGLAKRVLILCPAPLRDQWREEMHQKFDLTFDVAYRGTEVAKQDKLILSLTLGRNVADKLTKQPWDIVIVDEAHRAAGPGAHKTRDLITSLTTACRYAFFLTATPVQNDLLELYRLVELLRPGTFTSVNEFKRQFMRSHDPRTPNDPAALRRLISSAMIRTTRAQAGVDRVVRRAVDVPVDLGTRERELYAVSTDLLRNVMRDSGDTMRRRSLALRLTASPFSMGTTALRMAERHPDSRVRSVLNEVGHLAMDIQGSARENKALEITRDWLRDHGRVLIFTQHTDTVTGLLRRMEAEGLSARPFHGSMSVKERATTIAAFRSGDAPVMISTDAGAEGQNLQFCNCVLNFDLPWNPMRIEQRIGRVDRLTQPKDEVFVANLYARGTIDESVYRLLAEKLRMFELLFGQVTTILGELDDSKSATFESRVLEALFATSDSKMDGLLTQLGTELVHARERASTLIAADSGLSNWMAEAFEHRKGLTKAGNTDLAPEVSERARMRQRRVQTWTRKVLNALEAQILHDTGERDGAFITVQFDEEFEQELGGRTLIHLAFDRLGLEHHPDAELCAVGSPVFDELLGLLRMRGDMHATVPVIPDDIGPSPLEHAPTTTLVSRRLVPSGSWSGQATFRATVGEAETSEHLITAQINGHNPQHLPRRPLNDGESLPAAFDTAPKVIAHFEKSATAQLESLRRDRATQVLTDQTRELGRIQNGYQAQIAEAAYDDKVRLQRALRSEEKRLSRQPDVRARAKVLAVVLDEDDWVVEERWSGPGESEGTLTYAWDDDNPLVESAASADPISVLALCSTSHWVDDSETTHCESCDRFLCGACGDDAVFADCPICGLSSCGACRGQTGGLCVPCASPTRAPELDDEFAIAWTLNGAATLLVGERTARLTQADGQTHHLVPDEDVTNRVRERMRSYAARNDLPLDSGVTLRDLTGRNASRDMVREKLSTSEAVKIEYSLASAPSSSIHASAADDVPAYSAVPVTAEHKFRAGSLLQKLRSAVPPPPPPAVLVTRRSTFTDIYLEADGLVEEVLVIGDDGAPEACALNSADFEWREPSVLISEVAVAELGKLRITVQRRNEALLVTAKHLRDLWEKHWVACPEAYSVAHQIGCFDYLKSTRTPGGRLGRRAIEPHSITAPFPSPRECHLVDREIHPIAELVDLDSESELISADDESLHALGIKPNHAVARNTSPLPAGLNSALLDRAKRSFTAALRNGFEVTETWRGHGTANHEYRTFDGKPLAPKLDDLGTNDADFGVCRDGHFYAAGSSALCGACQAWSCRACDELDHQASLTCPGCATAVCRRCLQSSHVTSSIDCVLCHDHTCSDCGRDPQIAACTMCDRTMCVSCRVSDTCPACAQLSPAVETQLASLPADLAAAGTTALIGTDEDATVVLLNRGNAFEQAVVRNGSVEKWIAFDRISLDSAYRLRVAASASLGTQVAPTVEALDPEPQLGEPHVQVQSERTYRPTWSSEAFRLSEESATSFPTPDQDLATLVAKEFPTPGLLPDAVLTMPPALRELLGSMASPSTADLSIRWGRYGYDIIATREGLSERTFDGFTVSESMSPWARNDNSMLPWVAEAWQPAPELRAYTTAHGVEAVIAGLASMLVLGVRTEAGAQWYVISASPLAPIATMLSRSMGLGDADGVSVFTDPNKLMLSSVTNTSQSSINVNPVGALSPGSRFEADTTREALAAWAPDAEVVSPELGVLPHQLRLALEQLMRPAASPANLEIGAHVEQMVTVEGGHEWRYERRLAAGQMDARRINNSTGHVLDSGVIDREGHFGVGSSQCNYCGATTCSMCADKTVSCDGCTVPICKTCIVEPHNNLWLCPACVSTRRPTRSEAREHGRILSTRRMLIGSDQLHTVVVERSKNQWVRRDADGEKHVIASPSVTEFLDQRLETGGPESQQD